MNENKLKKSQIQDIDIESCAEEIKTPVVQLACPLSGHLLLGCVRIYKKKVEYLYADALKAVVKVKLSASVNMNRITIPEVFLELHIVKIDLSNLLLLKMA